jgi:hypothetical protein
MVERPTVTDRMRYLHIYLRVVLVMFGINLGIVFATIVTGTTNALVTTLFCAFASACAWFIMEIQIKRESNDSC